MAYDIYSDIATRTGGDVYLGVVGPVRTGKSTFIKRFMETMVLGRVEDENKKKRMIDELPQSADGKTIMTTEPKFVPNEAVRLSLEGCSAKIRLIDCVGYLIDDALGATEGMKDRMVKTPWSEEEMPFGKAGELGTEKVIKEHSNIGIVVTTDGTVTEIDRASYVGAEEKVVAELKEIGKPFIIVLNSRTPRAVDTESLRASLTEKYGVEVVAIDLSQATEDDFVKLLSSVLLEFPVKCINIELPKWLRTLDRKDKAMADIIGGIVGESEHIKKVKDYRRIEKLFDESDVLEGNPELMADTATGVITLRASAKSGVFYNILSEMTGLELNDEFNLMSYVKRLSQAEKEYEGIRKAMESVSETGYGIVEPDMNKIELQEPEIAKRGAQFGIRLKANAPSYHIIRVDVETEISPVIGSEQQSEELVRSLAAQFEGDRENIWNTNMFGRPLSSLVVDDLQQKIGCMPADAQTKLKRTISRIVNEGRGGVLCILL